MSQLILHFLDLPIPQESLWESLSHQEQQLILETLARIMTKAATAPPSDREANNE